MTMNIIEDNDERLKEESVSEGTLTPDEDRDLMALLGDNHITREYNIAKKMTMRLRDLKTRQWLLARRLATIPSESHEVRIDYSRLPLYNLALSIVELTLGDKNVRLPQLYDVKDKENLDKLLDSIDERTAVIESWPPPVLNNAIDAFDNLVAYITRISSPEKLENF